MKSNPKKLHLLYTPVEGVPSLLDVKKLITDFIIYKNLFSIFESLINKAIVAKNQNEDQTKHNQHSTSNSLLDVVLQIKAEGQYEEWNDLTTLSLVNFSLITLKKLTDY